MALAMKLLSQPGKFKKEVAFVSGLRAASVILGLILSLPALLHGQSSSGFGQSIVEVVSEWRGQDRGDGSGSYSLVTTLTDPSTEISIRHELSAERNVDGELSTSEGTVVLEGGDERYRADSDPTALGAYATLVTGWTLPFDLEFHPEPRGNYRAQQKRVAEVVNSVSEEAKVATRGGSDGRTSATVEIPGEHPANVLAERFVAIREALREADLGLAKLVLKGRATAPVSGGETAAGGETP